MSLGLFNTATLILIILKIIGVITVSWWIVFLPTFIWLGLIALLIIIGLVTALVAGYVATRNEDE